MTSIEDAPEGDAPARRADVEWADVDGETVVYDPSSNTLHRLNATAGAVWARCDGTASTSAIALAIANGYSEALNVIARDVAAVIQQFRRLGLLKP
jgi:hypothetical protein